jgi:hypothetical protein
VSCEIVTAIEVSTSSDKARVAEAEHLENRQPLRADHGVETETESDKTQRARLAGIIKKVDFSWLLGFQYKRSPLPLATPELKVSSTSIHSAHRR